ncbi:hypothetical protein BTO30_00595 [Domibacillus antri]|uniref:Uncharacterized protein n=1 Tax=Domibacillus antri TaxID=1714264 RepID=A0A1Q8Q9E9_9BACI|nr:hypothetical protein BTO30_00595 [Domibacillus antri]
MTIFNITTIETKKVTGFLDSCIKFLCILESGQDLIHSLLSIQEIASSLRLLNLSALFHLFHSYRNPTRL